MKLTIPKKIGRNTYNFEVEGKNLHEVVMESEKLSFRGVDKCGLCGSDILYLSAYVTKEKGFKYTKVNCGKCRASVTFGQRSDAPDTFYLRRNEKGLDWQEFVGKDTEQAKPTATIDLDDTDESVIPF